MTDPYVFWKLNETLGTTGAPVTDATSSGRDGTYQNDPTVNQTGLITTEPFGTSVLFSPVGGNDYVASTFILNTNTVTISAWVKLTAYGPNGGVSPIVAGFADGESSNVHDKNLLVEWDGAVRFYVYDGSIKYTSDPPFPLALNTIYHIAGTYDGTTIRAYVNGKEVGNNTASSSYTGYTVNNFFVSPRTGDASFEKFGGYVDNVAMWDSALTSSEILAQYHAGSSLYAGEVLIDDPVAYYRMNEGPDNSIILNPGFEVDTSGWEFYGAGDTITRVTSEHHAGVASLQVTSSAAGADHGGRTVDYDVPTDGRYYELRAWIKAPSGLVIRFQNSHGLGYNEITGNDAWQQVSGDTYVDTFTASPMYFIFSTPFAAGTFYIDEIYLFPIPQDSSGNGNHTISATGAASYQVASPIETDPSDYSMDFNGVSTFSADDSTSLDLGDVMTAEAWIISSDWDHGPTTHVISGRGTGALTWGVDQTTHKIFIAKADVAVICYSTVTVSTNLWYHVVYTKNGTTSNIYINGVDRTDTVTNATLADTTNDLVLAADYNTTSYRFYGALDEIAFYPTALSAARVLAHYEAALEEALAEYVTQFLSAIGW